MATTASKDYCDSCGQVAWLCICEPIEVKEERSNYCDSCGNWCCVSCKLTPKEHATSCEECGSAAIVKLEAYGDSFLAATICPKCGVSYDTNLDAADIEALR